MIGHRLAGMVISKYQRLPAFGEVAAQVGNPRCSRKRLVLQQRQAARFDALDTVLETLKTQEKAHARRPKH